MRADILSNSMAANLAYVAHTKFFRSELLSRNTKLKLYKTIIRPILTYGSKISAKTTQETNALRISERNIVGKIYGLLRVGKRCRMGTNKEIRDI